jgi:CheY-like chemotaxis protein
MDANVVGLILGLAVILVIAILLLRTQGRGGAGEATFSFAELFSATVKFGQQDTAGADRAAREAAKRHGKPLDAAESSVPQHLAARLARVLWVDDNPDNNLYETVALERLGRFVTKATSTDAGLEYLSQLAFALVITDIGRRDDPKGGITLIERMQESGITLPVVVYTMNAEKVRDEVVDAGAKAVVDTPAELLRQVEAQLAS